MKKLNSILLYLLAACFFTFTACNDDDEVTPQPQTQTPDTEEEEDPAEEEDPTEEEDPAEEEEPIEEEEPTDEEEPTEEEDPTEEETVTLETADFEGLVFPEGADAYFGQDKTGELSEDGTLYTYNFQSGNAVFGLNFITDQYGERWNGVAYSKQTDNTKEGLEGMLVAMPGEGANNSDVYAIMNGSNTITFISDNTDTQEEAEVQPISIQITNNAYVYSSLRTGDQFAKKFGGVDGNDPDYFKLIITGLDANGDETGEVEFYLADYRFEDNSQDYIVNSWENVDLSLLGTVSKISFSFESSDTGEWGMNTPAYFAFDELIVQPIETE